VDILELRKLEIAEDSLKGHSITGNENLLFTISGRKHQIRNNKIQVNIDKTTLTL